MYLLRSLGLGWGVEFCSLFGQSFAGVFCRDLACSAATFREIESDSDIGQDTSIAIAPNGLPIVSFENETDKQLEVAVARSLANTVFALDAVRTIWRTLDANLSA